MCRKCAQFAVEDRFPKDDNMSLPLVCIRVSLHFPDAHDIFPLSANGFVLTFPGVPFGSSLRLSLIHI